MNLGNINLRILETSDFTKEYLDWFDDKDIVEFSDNQYRKFTRKSQLEYIKRLKKDDSYNLYGIFYKKKHIGNILLGPINEIHQDLNLRPSGYEPDELPGCSTPRTRLLQRSSCIFKARQRPTLPCLKTKYHRR